MTLTSPGLLQGPAQQQHDPARRLSGLRLELLLHLLAAWPLVALGGFGLARLLSLPGWYAASAALWFLPVAALSWLDLPHHAIHARWGMANRITLLRGGLIALVGGALPLADALGDVQAWAVAVIAITALALDGVDGWVARRRGLASPYGARFDMELDALLILLLCLLLHLSGEAGVWVLGLGLLRPLFILAGKIWPVLAAPLPPSQRRRVICVVQVATLAAAATPWIESPLTSVATGAAFALLLFSFAADTVWLIRHGRRANGQE
jgi:phosphatidylglycerophosphate synthase